MNQNQNNLKGYLLDLTTDNYYNSRQGIVRVQHPTFKGRFFDFYLSDSAVVPHPSRHRVLVLTEDKTLDDLGIPEYRNVLPPGWNDKLGNLASIPAGICFLVDQQQRIKSSDPQTGSTGFSLSNINMFDPEKVRIAISPPITKSYTNNSNNDQDDNPIGLFMNDDAVMLRTRGGSITIADEGVHIGGNVFFESTAHGKEIMMDNSLHSLIPSTIVTAPVAIPQIPNFAMFMQIGDACGMFIEVASKAGKMAEIINRVAT